MKYKPASKDLGQPGLAYGISLLESGFGVITLADMKSATYALWNVKKNSPEVVCSQSNLETAVWELYRNLSLKQNKSGSVPAPLKTNRELAQSTSGPTWRSYASTGPTSATVKVPGSKRDDGFIELNFDDDDFDIDSLFTDEPNKKAKNVSIDTLKSGNSLGSVGDPCTRCEKPLQPAPLTNEAFCGACELELEKVK